MRFASLGLFCLASIALMIAVPAKLSARGPGSSRVKVSVVDGKDINFSHLSRQEGLSQSIVEHILQDDQGFMWFGTGDGLDRFDGYTFNQYKRGTSGSKDLSGVVVTALLKDRSGALWIGVDQSLDRLDPVTDAITSYRSDPKDPGSLGGRVYCIAEDGAGLLWLGTSNGLDKLDPITGRFTHYRHDPDDAGSLSADRGINDVRSITQDRAGSLWVQTSAGLDRFDTKTGEATHYPELRGRSEYDEHYQVYQDRSGTLWIVSDAGIALATFEPKSRKLTRYTLRLADPSLSDPEADVNRVRTILEDEDGVLWIGTGGNGLIKFDRKHRTVTRYRNDPVDRNSLSNNWVVCLFEDREGNIWAGTGGGGVNRFSSKPPPFAVYRNDARRSNRINQNFVLSVYEDSRGVLWVGNDSVLNAIDQKRGQVAPYRNNPANPNSISDGTVLSAAEGPSGALWFGTYHGGLNRFDPGSGQFKSYRHRSDDPNSPSSDDIFRLLSDQNGRMWIETDQGLNRFDPKTEHFTSYSGRFDNPNSPPAPSTEPGSVFRVLAEDQRGILWLGTYDNGATRFNPANGQSQAYKYDPLTPGSLSDNHVNAIYVDMSGTVWIGTERGLNKFDAGGSFTAYFEKDGLPDDAVRGILEDAGGNLWISTNNGLSKFNPTAKTFRNYHVEDGLAGNEFNSWGAPFKSARGEMFFPGIDGLTAFFPDKVTDNPYIPPIVLTDFRLFNENVPVGGHSPLKKAISYTDALELSHEQAVFSFEFSALSYFAPWANRYRYKLEGLETRWNEVSSAHRYGTYTTLPPGEYVFRVQGSNNHGVWNERGLSIRIRILPPWWSTRWFRAICAALILVSLWALYQLRIHQLTRQFDMTLGARVSERTRIARDLHDTLLQSFHGLLLRFQAASNQFSSRPDEAKKTLDHAIDEAAEAITEGRDAIQGLRFSTLETNDFALAVRTLGEELAAAQADMNSVVFHVEVEGSPRDLHPILRDEIYRIAGEAMRNAFKHAQARQIEVELRYDERQLRLRIRDDGKGIDPEMLNEGGRTGHYGLPGMRERATLLGGKLTVWSELESGTEVELSIPASRAYMKFPAPRRSSLSAKISGKFFDKDKEMKS